MFLRKRDNMLVQFSFSNYKCFKDEATLNLVAKNTKGKEHYSMATDFNYRVLKSVAVYGANASGKTKLFTAFKFLKMVIVPPKRDENVSLYDFWQTQYDAFRLNSQSQNDTSTFEVVFILDGIQYRYGIELNKERIVSEWLYSKDKREVAVFSREEGSVIKINESQIDSNIANTLISANMIASTSPFLAVLASFNDSLAKKIVNWFESVRIISANDLSFSETIRNIDQKNSIITFIKAFDINIEDFMLHEIEFNEIPDKIKKILSKEISTRVYDGVQTTHKVYNELYEKTYEELFQLEKDESFGTNRLFALSWLLISSLKEGTVLFIDEIDSGLHPNIVKAIIDLYYKIDSKAQLIINSQNTTLLNSTDEDGDKLYRKDQIYLVNKNRYGESTLFPLTDFDGDLRSNIEKIYLDGNLGGVPFINISSIINMIKNS